MIFSASVWWLIAAAFLAIVELMLSTFYMLVLAAAACVAAALAWAGLSMSLQVTAFAVVAIVGSIWVRRIRAIPTKSDAQAHELQNMDEGQIVDVTKWSEDGRAQVAYRGAQWTVIAQDKTALAVGPHRIVKVQGSVLVVEKASR